LANQVGEQFQNGALVPKPGRLPAVYYHSRQAVKSKIDLPSDNGRFRAAAQELKASSRTRARISGKFRVLKMSGRRLMIM
jgi:hypothetical protein